MSRECASRTHGREEGKRKRENIIDEDSPFQKYIPALDREKFRRISIQRKRRVRRRRRGVGREAKRRGGEWRRRTGDYPVGRYRRAAGNWSVLRERSTRAPRAHEFFFLLLFLHARPVFPFFPRPFFFVSRRGENFRLQMLRSESVRTNYPDVRMFRGKKDGQTVGGREGRSAGLVDNELRRDTSHLAHKRRVPSVVAVFTVPHFRRRQKSEKKKETGDFSRSPNLIVESSTRVHPP